LEKVNINANICRKKRKWKHQTTTETQTQYRKLNNKLRRITEEARETWWKEQCDELEEMQRQGRHDQVYQKIKQLSTKKNGKKQQPSRIRQARY